MAMTVMSKIAPLGDLSYYSDGFRIIIETHLQWLINHETTSVSTVEAGDGYRYSGDLDGLFSFIGLQTDMFWVTMRMNGYTSPIEYAGDKLDFLIPNRSTLNFLAQRYRQSQSIL